MVPFKTISLTTSQSATIGTTLSAQGIVYALGGNSSQWNSTYTTVQNNSASWEESAEILPTVTNYLSTSNVLISGLNVTNNLTVDTNTLFVDAANNRVGIGTTPAYKLDVDGTIGTNRNNIVLQTNGGSVSTDGTYGVYWNTSSGTTGSTDYGIYRTSGAWTASTYQQLKINFVTGIQLGAGTGVGTGYDKSYVEVVSGKGLMVTSGNVGIGTTSPSQKLTVSGNISATGTVFASAANISGDIVANRIQATVKNFYIKHPTKPDKHLVYSSLESPYNGIQLTGEDEVVNGLCVVELPGYLNNLIHPDSIHIQLTNYQHSKSLYVDRINIDQNNFIVKWDSWFSKSQKLKFFWLLNGVRKDIERLETEV